MLVYVGLSRSSSKVEGQGHRSKFTVKGESSSSAAAGMAYRNVVYYGKSVSGSRKAFSIEKQT